MKPSKHKTAEVRRAAVEEMLSPNRPSFREAAKKYGVTATAVMNWTIWHKEGRTLGRKERPWPTPSVRRYQDYVAAHPDATTKEICEALGVKTRRVSQIRKEIRDHAIRTD